MKNRKIEVYIKRSSDYRHLNTGGKIGNSCIGSFQARKPTTK